MYQRWRRRQCDDAGRPARRRRVAYVRFVDLLPTNGLIYIYKMPVTASSTPVGTATTLANPTMLYVDKSGKLFVPFLGSNLIWVYNTPLTTSGVPAFFLTTISPNPMSVTEDSAGNVYAGLSNLNCCIDVFPAPVTGAATAGLEVNANGVSPLGLGFVYGVAMDSSNNLYASSAGSGGVGHLSTIQMHTPMTASSKPAAAVGAAFPLYDVAVDASNNVYVTNATTQGTIDVFTQPFTSASKRSFGIVVHNGTYLQGLAFDGSGNLWVTDPTNAVWEIPAPITAASTATQVLTVPGAYGITFGP